MAQGLTPQEQEELRILLRRAFGESEAQTLLAAFERVAAQRTDVITRQDFQGLQGLVAQLVEGQRGLQEAVTRLTEAQARTEQRMNQLAEAQARTEQRMNQLAEAQARTEQRVGRLEESMTQLTQAQARTEQQVSRLAEAQERTERTLEQLARQVGGLSETVGGDIEDIAYIVLYDVLKREFGWEVGVLERVWQNWNGEPVELNVFGQARDPNRPDQTIWIVGEAKHNLTLREVDRFARQAAQARQHLQGEVFPVCFCYRARPEVRVRLEELGIRLVFSYGRLV